MRDALIAILLCGVAVAACEANQSEREAQKAAAVTAELAADLEADAGAGGDAAGVQFRADTDSGDIQLRLPGGIEGKFKLPEGIDADSDFDLEGIGRYPGARLTGVDLKVLDGDPKADATVRLAFMAPGSADTVADWYEKAFSDKGRSVLRNGTTLSSTTREGKPMVMTLRDGAGDVARGTLIIRDEKGR